MDSQEGMKWIGLEMNEWIHRLKWIGLDWR